MSPSQRLVVYSKNGCPFCSLLKMELSKRSIRFEEIDLSDDQVRETFYKNTGVSTVPQVFLTDNYVTETEPSGIRLGGWNEVSSDWNRVSFLSP